MRAELCSKGKRVMGLISQLPSLTSYSQQDGPGDVRAEDPGARGRDGVHHSPATWQLGTETLLPQRHDVPHRRPPQHGLVRTRPLNPELCLQPGPFQGEDTGGMDPGPQCPGYRLTLAAGSHYCVFCASATMCCALRFVYIRSDPCKNCAG